MTTAEAEITIEAPSFETVYIPVCDPSLVYGAWPYPAYPPDYFPGYFGGAAVGAFGCGWITAPIVGPLWGWRHWNWRRHRIDIDQEQFAALNSNRPATATPSGRTIRPIATAFPIRNLQVRDRLAGARFRPDCAGASVDIRRAPLR